MSTQMMWCPNCNPMVAPQKKSSHRAIVVIILAVIGVIMIYQGWLWAIAGTALLIIDGLLFVVGFFAELAEKAKPGHCPMCMGENLLSHKPEPASNEPVQQSVSIPPQATPQTTRPDLPPPPPVNSPAVQPPRMPPYSE